MILSHNGLLADTNCNLLASCATSGHFRYERWTHQRGGYAPVGNVGQQGHHAICH